MVIDDVQEDGCSDEPAPKSSPSSRAGSREQRGDVTQILSAIEQGDGQAAEQLLPLVYHELRRLAAAKMAQEDPGQTLQATALVHEAYIRLVDVKKVQHWNSRGHFFAAAAEAMRRILVENARRLARPRYGGRLHRVSLTDADLAVESPEDLLALDDVLERLERRDTIAARLVKLRFFAGMTMQQAAEILGTSQRSAERNWTYARAWLRAALAEESKLPE